MLKMLLDQRAERDALFAQELQKSNKSIDGCWNYVVSQAKKKVVNGCCAMTDDEVVGIAVHYYDEDDIEETKADEVKVVASVANIEAKQAKPAKPIIQQRPKKQVVDDGQLSLF